MDGFDIFEELLDNILDINSGNETTNETTEGLWFENGIKKNTGETIFFTGIGDSLDGFRPITRLGTLIDIPIAKAQDTLTPTAYKIPDSILFIANSGTKMNLKPGTFNIYNLDRTSTTYYVPATSEVGHIADATHDEVIATPKRWTEQKTPIDGNKYFNLSLQVHDVEAASYGPEVSVYNGVPGSVGMAAIPVYLVNSTFTAEKQNMTFVRSASWYESWLTSSVRNDIHYIKAVLVRDDANQKVVCYPFLEYYKVEESSSSIATYNINAVGNRELFSIPYSILNNEDYFDPEKDAGVEPDFDHDNSTPGGGGGNYINYPSNDIGLPELPTVGAIDTGFLTMYHPNNGQLQNLVNYLWTSDWIDNIKKMVSNPMDAIISLQLAPYTINSFVSSTCKIGAVNTQIGMNKVTNQYQILNCGTVRIPEHWGNALDYNNVNISIYLPFVGFRPLDTNVVMNSSIGLAYYVDLLTGSAIAMLIIQKTGTSQSVYYTFDCNLNYQIPITGANYSETMKALLSVGASAVGAGMSASSGNVSGALGATSAMIGSAFMAGSGAHHYESSGSLSANTGILGQYQPYMVVELPKQSLPRDFKKMKGYTSNITATLGSLSGYTVVESVHVDNIPGATDREKEMIEDLLKGGVIL